MSADRARLKREDRRQARIPKKANIWMKPAGFISAFAPVPHVGPDVDSAHSATEKAFLEYLKKDRTMEPSRIWICGQRTYAAMARDLGWHWTTVRRTVLSLRAKQSLDVRAVWARDHNGGRRLGTLYSIPAWVDTLRRRREIPGAARTPDGHLLYIGRARRIVTLDEATGDYGVDLAKIPLPKKPVRRSYEPAEPTEPVARAERPRRPVAPPVELAQSPDVQIVLDALLRHCAADQTDAIDLLALARDKNAAVPATAVVDFIGTIAHKKAKLAAKRHTENIVTPGWFRDRIPSYVFGWTQQQRATAEESAKAAKDAHDSRVSGLIEALRRLADPSLDDLEKEFRQTVINTADAAELAEARSALAAPAARRA